MIAGIWPTVKFTWMRERKRKKKEQLLFPFEVYKNLCEILKFYYLLLNSHTI